MKFYSKILLGALAGASPLSAQDFTMSVDALADPTSFSIVSGSDLSLRVAEQVAATGSNTSTHILIEGLSPIESGSQIYASTYRGINSASGEEADLGVLYLELPESSGLPEGTVSSPIVGVVQRSGSWSDYGLNTPSTSVGGSSGTSSADGSTIQISLTRGGETFSGTAAYTVLDTDTIELDPFTLSGSATVDLSGAILVRDGARFYGTLTNLSSGADYDAILFDVEFSDIPDVDGDGIPDISDDAVTGGGGLAIGEWTRLDFTWIYGLTAEWGITTQMGYLYVPNLPYVYQVNLGWMYYISSSGSSHIFYDWDLGYILMDEGNGGWYYYFQSDINNGNWANFSDPQP